MIFRKSTIEGRRQVSIKRSQALLRMDAFFEPGVPFYVNRVSESFDMLEHSHEFVELTYVSEGSGVHYIGGEAWPAEQGSLFLIPVGLSHVFRPKTPRKDRQLVVYNCIFPADYLRELETAFPRDREVFAAFLEPDMPWLEIKDQSGEYHALFRELYREYAGRSPGWLLLLTSLLVRVLTGLYRHKLQLDPPSVKRQGSLTIDESIAYMERHFASDLRLGELAVQASLSPRHFSRLFARQTGMSFTAYLQGIRMDAACRMLLESDGSVSEIAARAGYSDLKFFHRLFKQKTGLTPRQYRQRRKG